MNDENMYTYTMTYTHRWKSTNLPQNVYGCHWNVYTTTTCIHQPPHRVSQRDRSMSSHSLGKNGKEIGNEGKKATGTVRNVNLDTCK